MAIAISKTLCIDQVSLSAESPESRTASGRRSALSLANGCFHPGDDVCDCSSRMSTSLCNNHVTFDQRIFSHVAMFLLPCTGRVSHHTSCFPIMWTMFTRHTTAARTSSTLAKKLCLGDPDNQQIHANHDGQMQWQRMP